MRQLAQPEEMEGAGPLGGCGEADALGQLRRPSLAGCMPAGPLGGLCRALGASRLAPGEGVAPPMGEAVPGRGPLLLQRALPEAAVREPSSVLLPLPVPARQLCAAGISGLPHGCRGLEAVPDAGLDRSFPLFK